MKKIRHFVTANYRSLAKDIITGDGAYLSALRQLLQLSDSQNPELIEYGQCILIASSSIPDHARMFANLVQKPH